MRELALHILDIAENSVTAKAQTVEVAVAEDVQADRVEIMISDDGRGMDSATVASVCDPFVTSRTTRRVGLGIPFLKEAAESCNGRFSIESQAGVGTRVRASFQRSHIDRMPMGDLAGTFLTLLISFPDVHWVFRYQNGAAEIEFDDEPVKAMLEGVSLTEPSILAFVRGWLEDGFGEVQ